jgi:hypothetical protein
MQVDFLHRHVLSDVQVLHRDLCHLLPPVLPARHAQRAMNIGALITRLNTVTIAHGIRNELTDIRRNETPLAERLRFSAEWIPEELRRKSRRNEDITVHWLINPQMRRLAFTQVSWTLMLFMYWGYVMHELVHRYQYSKRDTDEFCRVYRPAAKESVNLRLHQEQLYLGEYDEIEAYARDIAFELLALYPHLTFRAAVQTMQQPEHMSTVLGSLVTYPIYRNAFSGTPDHPVMPVLYRKIRSWYQEMKQHRSLYDEMQLLHLPKSL